MMGWVPFKRKEPVVPADKPVYIGMVMRKHANPDKSYKGLEIINLDHGYFTVPTSTLQLGLQEGWITLPDGSSVVHRPGGNKINKWATTHTFLHTPTMAYHTLDGPVLFKVVHQPDKYGADEANRDADGDFVEDQTARVDWFYLIERVMP